MRRILFILWFLCFQQLNCFAQTSSSPSSEALKILLQKSKPDTNQLNLLLKLSRFYNSIDPQKSSSLDSALKYARQAERLAHSLKDNKGEASSNLVLAQVFAHKEDYKQGEICAKKAINIFSRLQLNIPLAESYMALVKNIEPYGSGLEEIVRLSELAANLFHLEKDKENEADAVKKWGEMLMYQGKMEEGLGKLKQSLVIYHSIGYEHVQYVYSLIGANYTQTGNFSEGLKYGLLAIKTAERLNDTSAHVGEIYDYLAVTYGRLNQLELASKNLKKAFLFAEKGDDLPLIILLATNIAHTDLSLNKPKEALNYLTNIVEKYPNITDLFARTGINSNFLKAYLQLNDYKNAGVYCEKLLKVSAEYRSDDPSLIIVYPLVCRYYLKTNQYNKAAKYLPLYKEVCEKNNFIPDLKTAHMLWFELDSAQGNYLSAIAHYQVFKTLNDSLLNEAKSKQVSELQIQYETEKKDNDILLLTEKGLLQQTLLEHEALYRNIILVGVMGLIFILVLLYKGYRLKQKVNTELSLHQEEIDRKNSSLQHLLTEKEWLLKEIHHRVNNNLQTVMSLLNSQSVFIQNEAALSAIKDSQHRVHSMSLIHQKLYNSESFSVIDMPSYIRELIEYMKDCFNTGQRIRFELNIEPLELDVSQAVPLGLILNEAITNAIKYAFPENREGIVSIQLEHIKDDHYKLIIADNGVGMPADFSKTRPGSLGLTLMKGLSEDLDGTFALENDNGTKLKISFEHDVSIKRMTNFTQVEQ